MLSQRQAFKFGTSVLKSYAVDECFVKTRRQPEAKDYARCNRAAAMEFAYGFQTAQRIFQPENGTADQSGHIGIPFAPRFQLPIFDCRISNTGQMYIVPEYSLTPKPRRQLYA